MKGIFKKMINMYKSSGNGNLNIQDSVPHGTNTNNKSKGNSDDNFIDNSDKQHFCFNTANYSYFWALAEWNQLTNTVSQNSNSIGITSGESSVISMTFNSTTTSPTKKRQKKMHIEDKTDQMISVVMGMR
jgi:beta-glucanase (GH16 family)